MPTLSLHQLLKKVPGFRSGSKLKEIIAMFFYSLIFLIFLAIVIPTAPTLSVDSITIANQGEAKIKGETRYNTPVWLLRDGQMIDQVRSVKGGGFEFEVKNLSENENKFTVKACNEKGQKHCTEKEITLTIPITTKSLVVMPTVTLITPSPIPTPTPTTEPYPLQFKDLGTYEKGNTEWRNVSISEPISSKDKLISFAKRLHEQYPNTYFHIFDDERYFEVYKNWDINYPKTEISDKDLSHNIGTINKTGCIERIGVNCWGLVLMLSANFLEWETIDLE